MTALAGFVGPRFATSLKSRACRSAIQAQSLYARHEPRIVEHDAAAFGCAGFHRTDAADGVLETDRWLFAADVRLDNRDDVSIQLGLAPDPPEISDAALLFRTWIDAELATLDRVVGDYAFAAFDKRSGALWLARDPTGQRPLFYAVLGGGAAFASMPSGLFEFAGAEPNIDRLALNLSNRGFHDEESYFVGIKRVLPGHVVGIDASGARSNRPYWRPSLKPLDAMPDTLVEECRELLDLSVAAHLRHAASAAPVSTHLSSGLDSSAVTATAARLIGPGDRLIAFTSAPIDMGRAVGPHNRPTDESETAAATADQLSIAHEVVRDPRDMFSLLANYSRDFQEPPRNVINLGWWDAISSRAEALGSEILLTAEFGNSTINAGAIEFLADYVAHLKFGRWLREARLLMRRNGVSWRGVAWNSFQQLVPAALMQAMTSRIQEANYPQPGFVHPDLIPPDAEDERGRYPYRAAGRLWGLTAADFGTVRKGTLGRHGIDERDPMSDPRLIEFGLRLPTEAFLSDGEYSSFARRVIADRVPRHVLEFSSRGFQGGDWPLRMNRTSAAETVESLSSSPGAQALLNIRQLKAVIDDWPQFSSASMSDLVFARNFTAALAAGSFVADVENSHQDFGRRR